MDVGIFLRCAGAFAGTGTCSHPDTIDVRNGTTRGRALGAADSKLPLKRIQDVGGIVEETMESDRYETDSLLSRIDHGGDAEQVRRDMALLILRHLNAKRDTLDSWEKMHYEMAIALLPTTWLRLAVTHIQMALEPPAERPKMDDDRARQFDSLTADRLVARLLDESD